MSQGVLSFHLRRETLWQDIHNTLLVTAACSQLRSFHGCLIYRSLLVMVIRGDSISQSSSH